VSGIAAPSRGEIGVIILTNSPKSFVSDGRTAESARRPLSGVCRLKVAAFTAAQAMVAPLRPERGACGAYARWIEGELLLRGWA